MVNSSYYLIFSYHDGGYYGVFSKAKKGALRFLLTKEPGESITPKDIIDHNPICFTDKHEAQYLADKLVKRLPEVVFYNVVEVNI